MNLIENALRIALDAHAGQSDKAGAPYVLHPIRVMMKLESAELQAAALLHDVLEDSDYKEADLRAAGIPEEVIDLVLAVTKREDEDTGDEAGYERFIERIATNPRAARIKLADIEDNLDVRRIRELKDKDLSRIRRYHRAWHRLKATLEGATGETGDDWRRKLPKGKRRMPPRKATGDEPIFRRGHMVGLPGSGVMPRRPGRGTEARNGDPEPDPSDG